MKVTTLERRVRKLIANLDQAGVTALYAREDAPHPLGFAIKKVRKEVLSGLGVSRE